MGLVVGGGFQNFNPRSREGSDGLLIDPDEYLINFNPRSREGSDFCGYFSSIQDEVISIHAPARGATQMVYNRIRNQIFQSTLPRGERRCNHKRTNVRGHFNPRSREGSDVQSAERQRRACNFNPRSREGSDNATHGIVEYWLISIHAPARGATSTLAYLHVS